MRVWIRVVRSESICKRETMCWFRYITLVFLTCEDPLLRRQTGSAWQWPLPITFPVLPFSFPTFSTLAIPPLFFYLSHLFFSLPHPSSLSLFYATHPIPSPQVPRGGFYFVRWQQIFMCTINYYNNTKISDLSFFIQH